MASSSKAEPLLLTGADCFLRAFEAEVRRKGGASHLSQLVLRLGPGFDVEAFRKLIGEVAAANEIMRSPIGRRGLVGAPVYRLDRPAPPPGVVMELHDAPPLVATGQDDGADDGASVLGPVPEVFARRLNGRMDPRVGKLVRFDIVPRGGAHPGHDVAMTWLHMLFDGSGSEHFVEHLAACSADASRSRTITIDRGDNGISSPAVASLPTGAGVRGKMAGTWQTYMKGLAARPPTSLAGPLRRQSQDLIYHQLRLEQVDGKAASDRAKKMAGFLTPMLFYLAVAVRAHRAVAIHRGRMPASWVVPLPVNMRPKGGQGEIFRTHVSLLWFQVTPEQAEDLATLIEVLKAQRLDAVRNKLVEAGVAAMDFARIAPARLYTHMARRNFAGELASFFFAYTDQFAPEARTLCGATIADGFHVPSVPTSPGSALVFCLRDGLNVIHVHQQGSIAKAEQALMREHILSDLRG